MAGRACFDCSCPCEITRCNEELLEHTKVGLQLLEQGAYPWHYGMSAEDSVRCQQCVVLVHERRQAASSDQVHVGAIHEAAMSTYT